CAWSTLRARSSAWPRSAWRRPRCAAPSRGWKNAAGGLRGTPMTDAQKFIAIDGPAGSGKSSVSKAIARRLGYGYLDTGAAYRALAWHVLEQGADTADAEAVRSDASDFPLIQRLDPDDRRVLVGEAHVTDAIRAPRVSAAVSGVARVPEVRVQVN